MQLCPRDNTSFHLDAADCAECGCDNLAAAADPIYAEIPHMFLCPITIAPMADPVMLGDGFCYERSAIERWLFDNDTSPMTGKTLAQTTTLAPVRALQQAIEWWRSKRAHLT